MVTDQLTANLAAKRYSLRDFLAVITAARSARQPIDVAIDRLLDMLAEH